jgi:ribosomal protein S18 acetylase RimI-like enzyme
MLNMDRTHPPFLNPYWQALTTEQSAIAVGSTLARRYPADVIPFAGVVETSVRAFNALRDLLAPQESIYITGEDLPEIPGLERRGSISGWQMHFSKPIPDADPPGPPIVPLGASDSPAMVALTDAAFPGFFRTRTYTLGHYFGIHVDGALVAMAGERIVLPGYREISAVCTLPGYTGKGYAAHLLRHVVRFHAVSGLRSFLHVAGNNQRAIDLYERLGFQKTAPISFNRLRRVEM